MEFLVNQHIPGDQAYPHVVSGDDDTYVIVWRSWGQHGSGGSVLARRYDASHTALTDEILVSTGLGSSDQARVYRWSEGRFVIVWSIGGSKSFRVMQADNSLGDVHGLPIGVEYDIDIDNDMLVAAYRSQPHIYVRKWDLLTNAWTGSAVQVSEAPADNYQLPQVRWTSTGSIVIIYKRNVSPQHIYRKTFNAALLAQTPETSVYTQGGSLGAITVSINAQDQLLIYTRWGVNGPSVFRGLVLDATGDVLVDYVGGAGAPYAYPYTDCELYDNGSLVLTNNYKTSLDDPLDYCVRVNYAMYLGAPSTGFQFATTTTSGPQRFPAVTKLPNEGFLVVWTGNGFQGDDEGVYARAFAAADFPTAAPEHEGLAFEAYPNPFRDRLVVSLEEPGPLQVFDATGRVVHTERMVAGPNAFPLEQLASGTYLLVWHAANGTRLTHRVVKE